MENRRPIRTRIARGLALRFPISHHVTLHSQRLTVHSDPLVIPSNPLPTTTHGGLHENSAIPSYAASTSVAITVQQQPYNLAPSRRMSFYQPFVIAATPLRSHPIRRSAAAPPAPYDEEAAVEQAMRESLAMAAATPVPAARASIKAALKEVTDVRGLSGSGVCTVCLEELYCPPRRLKVVNMPCSHLFHKTCIVKWLKTSHVCPICRYPVPT